jgi:hypothetical protein
VPGAYLSLLLILAVSALSGQALFALCGRRDWSWLSPAVGLGLCCALGWATVRLPGEGSTALIALAVMAMVSLAILGSDWRRYWAEIRPGLPALAGALVLVSLPFIVERHVGILGTSLNPDMSQHLFAADRLADGGTERLISQGYPLGPHSLVVALTVLGPSLVGGFGGLTLAISVCACLAPLELLGRMPPARRTAGALLIGLAYMAASYLIQGAFKETMQAMLLLSFAIAMQQLALGRLGGAAPAPRWRKLGAVPLSALAIGAAYSYSFPGLLWMLGGLGIWILAEMAVARRSPRNGLAKLMIGERNVRKRVVAALMPPAAIALATLLVAVAPELGRMSHFASFETFDPKGAGLGNLFNPISPLEALGVWPSGDFRLDAGAGFAPAIAFWAGALLAALALGVGLLRNWRAGERALGAALAAAAALYLYALVSGTPYQEAKAIAVAAPLAALIAVRAVLEAAPPLAELRRATPGTLVFGAAGAAFLAACAICSLLALGNGPVGPSKWSPALTEFRQSGELHGFSTLVVAPSQHYLSDEHGTDLIAWELRGNRVCISTEPSGLGANGEARLITFPGVSGPEGGQRLDDVDGYALWRTQDAAGSGTCPLDGTDRAEPAD